ncbi:dedicator of cytokinesis protein 3-like, partial [Salvelinus sp. IW2-2015]|uniref:dedicator of cytokinesis protein 3-like n=1 Tax=Salvelinus sp. IW2-2015 TaxID=2691554 RepID=UPI0038D4BDA4
MSPDSFKSFTGNSPLNLLGSIRHSSSSLSSHTSSETGNLVILTDGMVMEHTGGHLPYAAQSFVLQSELHPLSPLPDDHLCPNSIR